MKKFLVVFFIMCMVLSISTVFAITFTDLASDHWAYKYITDLTGKGVINGYKESNGTYTFKPSGTITRGEFLKLVMEASLPQNIDMKDAESNMKHWAGKYVWLAERYGVITTGTITNENINLPITRIEMVRMVARADIILKGKDLDQSKKLAFSDVLLLSKDDESFLTHAYSRGLITGYEDGTFGGQNSMTRAEAATMIYRFTN